MTKIGIVLLTAILSLNVVNYSPNVSNDIKTFLSIENLDNHDKKEEIKDCSAGVMSSGSCVRSLGDVCVRFSEWFINEKWESDDDDDDDDDDDSCETDVCESPN